MRTNSQGSLFAEERRRKILEILQKDGRISVSELSQRFKVSQVTIRKDLETLEREGKIIRTHGGAVLPSALRMEIDFLKKLHRNAKLKIEIAKKAVELIKPEMTIILDSGSTNLFLAKEIKNSKLSNITVVTNNTYIAQELMNAHVEIIILGGYIREHSLSIVGKFAVEQLELLNVNIAFLGTTGFSKERGFMTPSIVEAEVKSKMVQIADKVVIVADSSKFSRRAFAVFCKHEEVDMVITDRGINNTIKDLLKDKGIEVVTV